MHDIVQQYYGATLSSSLDLQTNACTTGDNLPEYVKPILARIHSEVLTRYYGCGLVLPELLEDLTVLDLGCGAGRDVYVLSKLVGENGRVVGVDMTEEQLAVARQHEEYHRKVFGYAASNVRFLHGYIERLSELKLADASVDVIVSNCVLNLAPDKAAVLREAWRVLKPGGELYFSDIYTDRRVPATLSADPVLYGECLSGALYWNDFINLSLKHGFDDPRLIDDRRVVLRNAELAPALATSVFSPRLTACSKWTIWSRHARTMAKRSFIAAQYHITPMCSCSTSITASKRESIFRFAGTLGACCTTAGSPRILSSMATSSGITAFFPAAAWGFPMTTTSMTAGPHEPVDAVSDGHAARA